MSDASAPFAKFVPGFDFLQGLVKNAGAALPGMNQWIAPTLDPAELEKRIGELRTVQFWLEQNVRMLGATIQALEVQRMTLSTLQSMNVPVAELGKALQARVPEAPPPAPAAPAPAAAAAAAPPPSAGPIDPMQWWGALTKQFSELAASAIKEVPADLAKGLSAAVGTPAAAAPAASTASAAKRAAGAPAAKSRRAAAPRKRAG